MIVVVVRVEDVVKMVVDVEVQIVSELVVVVRLHLVE